MIRSETINYVADGLSMIGQLYAQDATAAPRPGVLVFPEAFGLGYHAKSRAERLAGLGYVALACDLHGGGQVLDDLGAVMGLIGPMRADPASTRARARGGLDALLKQPGVDQARIGAIGFCFGGTMALELARSGADLAGVVGFHSGLLTARPQDATSIKGKVLACIGADDPAVPFDERRAFEEEMRAGGVDWQLHVYGGVVHSFTNKNADRMNRPEMVRYDAKTDARSWASMQSFFTEVFAA
ncbi:dienelactone hydrolase family protein [Lichenihabitans sp. Uapishka_5]|uniref:dienelactone hydrolase family protein n=1 Tax=Lichenihabitans sp. Uapishka_5 TaxID=3037302 RepID=UPI0029E80EC7|nr:dienelactone hydrolase family protein [Lichenihabitans sp. Uapishka_5]MDX7952357.1 dienelactone hydrolase family protein [Lichenihabitans sp. Uapishka_5]